MDASNFQLVTTPGEVRAAVEQLERHQAVGFDAETTALDPRAGRLRLLQLAAPGLPVYLFDLFRLAPDGDAAHSEALAPLRRLLAAKRPVKTGHNTKFDAKWVRLHLGVELGGEYDTRANGNGVETVERGGLFDTLLASQLVSAGEQEDRHSLRSVVERYLDESVDKALQVSDWGGELSAGQLEYAARDAAVLLPLRDKLVEQLRANSLGRCAQLEFECVVPLAGLELAGIHLDQARWRELLAGIGQRRDALHEELQSELAEEAAQGSLFFGSVREDINLDSHVQLTKALTRLGVPVPDSTRNWKLEPLAAEFPVVGRILEYRTLQKTLKFGESLLEAINPKTGRIHAHFHQIGAPTGRMSCLAGDTLVPTDAGFKLMKELKAGDRVRTSYGFKRVEKAWSNGTRHLFRLRLRDGHSIRATADHRFLAGRGDTWKRLDELAPGDYVFVSLKADGAEGAGRFASRFGLLPSLKPVVACLERGLRAVAIESITPDANEEVYDISVEGVHEFVADGIVVHNCTDPNVQQIPHGAEFRRCFRAPAGRKLITADYSQIELRILADFTGDRGFVDAFQSGADLHRVTAAQVFNVPVEAVTKQQRDFAKRLNFGVVYGIGAQRFALMTGLSTAEAEDLLRRYFASYRGLDVWLRDAAQRAVRDRTAPRTVAGRLFRFNFDAEDRQAAGLAQRNGKNSPIQGSSADIIKRALRLLHDRLKGTGACVVNVVHDEIVVETDADGAEEMAKAVEDAMCKAGEEYLKRVPVKVESQVADEWAK